MSPVPADPPLTGARALAAIAAAPEHKVAEILEGRLHLSPRPRVRHSRSMSALGAKLFNAFDGESEDQGELGGWVFLFEPELHFGPGPDVLVPDIAGWRRSRMPILPDTTHLELAPDWVCEVLSPSTRTIDRGPKRRIYAREGVRHLWLLEPDGRTLEVFALDAEGSYRLANTWTQDAVVRAEPFAALELPLTSLWLRAPSSPAPAAHR